LKVVNRFFNSIIFVKIQIAEKLRPFFLNILQTIVNLKELKDLFFNKKVPIFETNTTYSIFMFNKSIRL